MPLKKNLIGKVFGQLSVLEETIDRAPDRSLNWLCMCSCGMTTKKSTRNLIHDGASHCGCNHFSVRYPKEYQAWVDMHRRCENKHEPRSKYWGMLGVTVETVEWTSFLVFLHDMGVAPSRFHSLDRIESNKGYSKSNCRWALPHIQSENRSYAVIRRI